MRTTRRVVTTVVGAVVLAVMSLLSPGQASADYVNSSLCLQNEDGRDECFWVGTVVTYRVPGTVYHQWETAVGGSWYGPQSLNFTATSGIDGARNEDGRLEVFARGNNSQLYHAWQLSPGGAWSGWQTLGGSIANAPGSSGPFVYTAGDRIYVNIRSSDGVWRARYQTQPNCCWSGWVVI